MKLKILLVVLILTSVFCMSSTALAMTEAERQAMIIQIQQQIAQLMLQLEQMIVQDAADPSWCHTFYSNIGYAQSGTIEVVYLHIALLKQGIAYGPDNIFSYTPNGTLQAVIQFQTRYGIYPHSGWVGPLTRAKLNQLYACGSTTCTPNWSCGSWGSCYSGQQTRTCTDSNYCGITTNKPATIQSCGTTCTPSWQTGNWGTCTNGQQTRTVTDLNNCGVTTNKPNTTQACTTSCTPNWICGSWGSCYSGQHTRTCTDSNNCGVTTNKPATTESCGTTCTPSWQTGTWGTCTNGQHTRTVTDLNYCGVTTNKPATTESCSTCTPNWTCGEWSSCVSGHHTRTCIDTNGCGGTRPAEYPVSESCTLQLTTINLIPTSVNLFYNGSPKTQQLTAKDQDGNQISTPLTWNSTKPSVATVGSSGLVTAVTAGAVYVYASSGSVVSNNVQIIVERAPPTSITITPASATLVVNGSPTTVSLFAKDQNNIVINDIVHWAANDYNTVVTVSGGIVTAVGRGTARITASYGSVSGSSNITVNAIAPIAFINCINYVAPNERFTVNWSSTNADSCQVRRTISPETDVIWTCNNEIACASGSISQTGWPYGGTMVYTINCSNTAGLITTDSAIVTVQGHYY